jgi:molecular chaperone HtpG
VALADNVPAEKPETQPEEKEKIADADFGPLLERFKQTLGDRVADVRSTDRLSTSVARLVEPEGSMNPEMQRVYKYLGKDFETSKKILELNPAHEILKSLLDMQPESDLQRIVIEQIYDSALLVEGLHPDPSSMVSRVQELMLAALAKK